MFTKFNKIWQKYGFEIILVGCIIFILIFALFRIGKPGSWSSSYTYIPINKKSTSSYSDHTPKRKAEVRLNVEEYSKNIYKSHFQTVDQIFYAIQLQEETIIWN